jgi:hypothetical protein
MWGFSHCTTEQTIVIRPKKPQKLLAWIDAAIDGAKIRPQLEAMLKQKS